jgi:hypothetical protein
MKFAARMAACLSCIFTFFWLYFYHFIYGCMFCTLLLIFVNYMYLMLCTLVVMLRIILLVCVFLLSCYVPFWVFFSLCFCILFVCKCVLYYCHRGSTQLQLHIISYDILRQINPLCAVFSSSNRDPLQYYPPIHPYVFHIQSSVFLFPQ